MMIGVREFSRKTSEVLRSIDESGRPAVLTNHGKPRYLITAISEEEWEDYVLANAPEFVESMRTAGENDRLGRTKPMREVFAEIDAEEELARRELSRATRELS